MQRKAYVPGAAALLAALLAGCTGGSAGSGSTDDANPGDGGTATAAPQPGKYRTLPEPCGVVGHGTLDSLLPGIPQLADDELRDTAYEGEATLTYDTDRKVGCRWKIQSAQATDHLLVDFERVVSYDNSVSDDTQAQQVFAVRQDAAHLPEPTASESASPSPTGSAASGPSPNGSASASATGSPSASASASASVTPADLRPRILGGLGDEAFLDDALAGSGSTARQRTVTVAFRTSNVIVTVEYVEQPVTAGTVPDSKEMQDRARKLAVQLAGKLGV
ncbi:MULTISPECIES: hypothetical protein [Streptomyces]|uniref:DUF3558 domain-containing protein n=1 Tax=Streptomyces doudnae TaxID=3075536 RepID=A0ABD5EX73_9ACTN|nr:MULTISPECIES: hypothetical protein [unclassified Streptomyces]MDT0439337.1 DUF3558 domain-containing protein [Streptomyces sp. DSM 41981]MYQ68400.1 DUF3558 domain-containing protein [Streptomyces sp. SID4950]SCE45849.1 hypothetical protein GA0115242_139017 [Streptomyces sp. SolWspMP-5a-2]